MKRFVIKVIKRKTITDTASISPIKRCRVQTETMTTTVKDWIAESRKDRLEKDNFYRETISRWTAEANA